MFRTEQELLAWLESASLGKEACEVIQAVRSSEPAARVRSGTRNVSGRYPSRKMGRTIQFSAHRNQLAVIIEMEHEDDVIEYWDLPPSVKLVYETKAGKVRAVINSPHFFVVRKGCAGWVECRTEEDLTSLSVKQPNLYRHDPDAGWRCPPGDAYANPLGLGYWVRSSAEIDWVFQRNALFLEDYLRADSFDVPHEVATYLQSLAAAKPGISLSEMLDIIAEHDLSSDSIYILIVTDGLYVDLSKYALAEPDAARIYLNQLSASRHESVAPSVFRLAAKLPAIQAGNKIGWDDRVWEVLNVGEKQTWLRNDEGRIITLDNSDFHNLDGNGFIERLNVGAFRDDTTQLLRQLLTKAGPSDLAEANRRYKLLAAFWANVQPDNPTVSERTLFRWQAKYRAAEAASGCGFSSLLPRTLARGNRTRKLPQQTVDLTQEFIEKEYENPRQPTRHEVWAKLCKECKERGIIAPSYQTFCAEVRNRPTHRQIVKRQGSKAGYSTETFYMELDVKTPPHGDRPFEIAHIDHTELDIELVCSKTGENLGRPWLTLLTDAYSRRILAFCLLFDPPSVVSCMMVLRECVMRHHRLPQTIVHDGGREFGSIYFESLLAIFECTQKIRPVSKSRFGSVCERLFGTTNTRFIYNLLGNTQLTKKNARLLTKEVNPKKLAVWTLVDLHERMSEFAYEVYDTLSHPALGQSPREAFTMALAQSGHRESRYISYNEEFEMLTLPTTAKGTACVEISRGVQINYFYYWNDVMRDPSVERTQVLVRYDPFDASKAYAFIHGEWRRCISAHNWRLSDRSKQELKLASAELRRRSQQHARRFNINAFKLAEFLSAVEAQEHSLISLQRKRDDEVRRIIRKEKSTSSQTFPKEGLSSPTIELSSPTNYSFPTNGCVLSYRPLTDDVEDVDLTSLESYEEY